MKLKRIALLLLAALMLACTFSSCASTTKTTVKITFIDESGDVVIDTYTAELKTEKPTVLDAVKAVKDVYATAEGYGQITLSDDGTSVKNVDSYKENLTPNADGDIFFWMFLVNGKEPSGDANEVSVSTDDNIVFQFVKRTLEE